MKTVATGFFVLSFFLLNTLAWGQLNTWRTQSPPTVAGTLNAVQMISPHTAYIVGDKTTFLVLSDSGREWKVQSGISPDKKLRNNHLNALSFIDSTHGMVVGIGQALKTIDGGKTWTKMTLPGTSTYYYGVLMVTDSIAIIIGKGSQVLRTVDAGKNWREYAYELGIGTLTSIKKVRANFLVATGDEGYLIFSNDSGFTWTKQKSDFGNTIYSVAFEDENNGVAVGDNGYVVTTQNHGANWLLHTWDTMGFGVPEKLNAVETRFPGHYVVAGNGGRLLYSTDGGYHWHEGHKDIFLITGFNFNGLWMWDKNYGIAVGDNGYLVKTTDGGANWKFLPQNPLFYRLNSIAFPKGDSSNGIAVGNYGTILRTTNGGKQWLDASHDSLRLRDFYSITFADSKTAYMAGEYGLTYRSTDFGISWTTLPTLTKNTLRSISFIDASNGWVAGEFNVLLETNSGGEQWHYLFNGVCPDTVVTVSFCNSNDGITGRLITTNGGISWDTSKISTPGIQTYSKMVGPNHYVICTYYEIDIYHIVGMIYTKLGDSLYTFGSIDSTNQTIFSGIDFADSLHGTVVGTSRWDGEAGQGGITYQTTDGGKTWVSQYNSVSVGLLGVSMPLNYVASACGIRGTIIRRTNTKPVASVTEHGASTNASLDIVSLYPNPVSDQATLKVQLWKPMPVTIKVYDQLGKQLADFDLGQRTEGEYEIPLYFTGLSAGAYILEVRSGGEVRRVQVRVM